MAFLPTRRSWRRFSHAPPTLSAFGEPANQRHASCSSRSGFRSGLERNCRAAASQIRLGALPPAPTPLTPKHSSGTLLERGYGHYLTFPPPSRRLQIASHCFALVAATGVPAAPRDDLVLRGWQRAQNTREAISNLVCIVTTNSWQSCLLREH